MKVLVLGGYGLIGLAIVRTLTTAGHEVTGLGRSVRKGEAAAPDARWISADLSRLTDTAGWRPLLEGFEVVVNASGVLQDGLTDRVAAVQRDAVRALAEAGREAGIRQVIQISAPGLSAEADTAFYRTKHEGDATIRASGMDWVILRPGLVLSPHAYGGTGLLRQLAAVPLVQPVMLPGAPVQTVHVGDVAAAVLHSIEHRLSGIDADLVAPGSVTLEQLILSVRRWLGFPAPSAVIRVPAPLGRIAARLGDLAGWLGWRPALRTTSLRVLKTGVTGNADIWPALAGQELRPLAQSLQDLPSTVQERTYARAALFFPVLLLLLSGFWIASGAIGWLEREAAADVLAGFVPAGTAQTLVAGGSLADILIGAGLLLRPLTRPAALAAIGLSLAYLVSGTILTPHLWADPLGPLVKIFPAMGLALAVWVLSEPR